jgi:acyl carrier protein
MEDRIKEIIAIVLDINPSNIHSGTSTDTLDVWDSMKHMDLIVALEEEFGIEFDDQEVIEMTDYAKVKQFLMNKVPS